MQMEIILISFQASPAKEDRGKEFYSNSISFFIVTRRSSGEKDWR